MPLDSIRWLSITESLEPTAQARRHRRHEQWGNAGEGTRRALSLAQRALAAGFTAVACCSLRLADHETPVHCTAIFESRAGPRRLGKGFLAAPRASGAGADGVWIHLDRCCTTDVGPTSADPGANHRLGHGRVAQHACARMYHPIGSALPQGAAKAFVLALPDNVRIAVVSYAGIAQVVQPPTTDKEAVVEAIGRFQLQRGTAIGNLVSPCLSPPFFPKTGSMYRSLTCRAHCRMGTHPSKTTQPRARLRRSRQGRTVRCHHPSHRRTEPDGVRSYGRGSDGRRPGRQSLHGWCWHPRRRIARSGRMEDARPPGRRNTEANFQSHSGEVFPTRAR